MYPSGELKRLAARKELLQAQIAVRRWECAVAAAEIARPIAFIDRGLEIWNRISPFVSILRVPLGLLLTRFLLGKRKGRRVGRSKVAAIFAALPLILRAINLVKKMRGTPAPHRKAHAVANPAAGTQG